MGKFEIKWINRGMGKFEIKWIRQHPDPAFPHGKDIDLAMGREPSCSTPLPYPTGKGTIGGWRVRCQECGLSVYVTAASRPDDPCSLKVACKERLHGYRASRA